MTTDILTDSQICTNLNTYHHTLTIDRFNYSILWHTATSTYAVIDPEGDLVIAPNWKPFFSEQEAIAWCEDDAQRRVQS